jgi:hypothetical protein
MPNTNLWRFKHYIYDGCKMMISAATSLMTSQPRHLPAWHTAAYDQHKTTFVTKPDRHTTATTPSVIQANGRLWRKSIVTKCINGVNGDVSYPGRHEIMTKTGYNLWPKTFVIEWIQIHDDTKFVTDWRHIYDEKTNFVTDGQMWCHHSDQTKIVTKTSQKTNCDHSGVFNNDNATSLMTTSLLV